MKLRNDTRLHAPRSTARVFYFLAHAAAVSGCGHLTTAEAVNATHYATGAIEPAALAVVDEYCELDTVIPEQCEHMRDLTAQLLEHTSAARDDIAKAKAIAEQIDEAIRVHREAVK